MVASPHVFEQRALELLEKTDIVASTPHALETVVEPYVLAPDADDDAPGGAKSMLLMLQTQLQREGTLGWEFACIPRPYSDEHAGETAKHAMPAIAFPSPINPGPRPLFPEAFMSLYADQDVEVGGVDLRSTCRNYAGLYCTTVLWFVRFCIRSTVYSECFIASDLNHIVSLISAQSYRVPYVGNALT